MSKTFRFSGKRITIKGLTAAVSSGTLARQNGFIGIPETHAPIGGSVAFALTGVHALTYGAFGGLDGVSIPAGSLLYWDTSAGALSIGYGDDDYAAVKVVTAVNQSTGAFEGLLLNQFAPMNQEQ